MTGTPASHSDLAADRPAVLPAYLLLFGTLFLGWGVLSPFLPPVLARQGASASEIGLLLGLGIVLRLAAMPMAGAISDRHDAPRGLLAAALVCAALSGLCYGLATGPAMLLLVGIAHALATAPVGFLPDALAVRAAALAGRGRSGRMDYGTVRGFGAASFIVGSTCAGLAVEWAASPLVVLWLNAGLFGLAAGAALRLPRPGLLHHAGPRIGVGWAAIRALLGMPVFRRLLLVSGLIQGSHAFYTGFAVLSWEKAGIAPGIIGILWSISVAAEVAVFFLLGRRMLAALGPGGVCILAAAAGILRWSAMALSIAVPVLALAQLLHGVTFAAQHLAAMAVVARIAPDHQAATAQSLLATLGTGLFSAVLMLASGPAYAWLGTGGFWAMALLCGAALVPAVRLRAMSGS